MERRLSAILAADVVGYSGLMATDEAGTLAALKTYRFEIFDPAIAKYGGRIVKLMGDGSLVEFPSAVNAVQSAMDIQRFSRETESPIQLRIGINLGDVIIEGDDIYGDGVNLAARLEQMAEPGGILVSDDIQRFTAGKVNGQFDDLGERVFKNIDKPARVWSWKASRNPSATNSGSNQKQREPLSLPDKPSVAVLPFDNMSGDPEQEYFADGVVEALTAALSRIRSFFVIARNSAFTYKGQSTNVRDIGRELGVGYILEGSVQRAGGRVRITVQLIETDTGAHIWAEKYDGSLDDIFDLQDRITEQVAGALQPSIRLAEIERVGRKRPQDFSAYDYTMRALRHVWMLEKNEAEKALGLLNKALESEPDYPLALALAAWCHAQRSVYNWVSDIGTSKAEALRLAERAADLSSDDPLILTVLGTVHTFVRNFGTARVLLQRAVALDPNSAWAWSRFGWLAAYSDRPSEAREHFEKALRLSPLDPMNFNNYVGLGSACQVAGDDSTAADMFLRALDERPNAFWIHRNLAPALLGAGRIDEAKASGETLLKAYPEMTVKSYKDAMVFSSSVLDRIGKQLAELGLPES
ncbi:adenylate/guanylate cyclase domain-containing protein [Microbaculum sp. FT89]|uniref:adenylate/guanylate cyclase domain-containing protein n=1 Tax=Microbaculum sp. FT89 TaxID=3447298 RepID=UPI003F53CC45